MTVSRAGGSAVATMVEVKHPIPGAGPADRAGVAHRRRSDRHPLQLARTVVAGLTWECGSERACHELLAKAIPVYFAPLP